MDYKPLSFEEEWHRQWETNELYSVNNDKDRPPYYVLEMFPYPSGQLHMGHVRNYVIGDSLARYKRMCGFNVLYPMGFDSFGLPAENAAIKHDVNPKEWTAKNVESMKVQLKRLGLSYDWSKEIATYKEDYYKWNQWLFVKMFKKGLIYKKKGWVNWDPVDQTVLANEQVIDGKGWRSGADVVKRDIDQWYIKITDYAEELLNDLDSLDHWPDRVKSMQRYWIGKSTGTEIIFDVVDSNNAKLDALTVFTTRPDTLFGATYVSVAAEHSLVEQCLSLVKDKDQLKRFVDEVINQPVIERTDASRSKKGMWLGVYAINPVNNEKVPVYVSDYVLMDYGSGAVMAVPAHDQRDFDFAASHDLPMRLVIQPVDNDTLSVENLTEAFCDSGRLVASGTFTGMSSEDAKKAITVFLENQKKGQEKIQYKLRDWLISRQRYWGTPIPMIYDEEGKAHPVNESDLPVKLPEDVTFSGQGNPLMSSPEFVSYQKDGKEFRRETDTMDTFFDSSWYFLRYCDSQNTTLPFAKENADRWMGVNQYIGGIEHAVLHLLYARFFTKVCRDLGLVSVNEPFERLLCQGMVLKDGAKMSKSQGNTVDPSHIINEYGADTARLFILFGAPVERDLEWSDQGVEGSFRFLKRFYKMVADYKSFPLSTSEDELNRMLHKTIKAVTDDFSRFSFNTVISRLMELTNFMYQFGTTKSAVSNMVLLLAPIAPFIAEELWSLLRNDTSVHQQSWPTYDETLLVSAEVEVVCQINGKLRERLKVASGADQSAVEDIAKESDKIKTYLSQGDIKKVIYVKDKLINFVVR